MYSENKNPDAKDLVQVTKRQATLVAVATLFICIFMFIVGYFVGKKSVLDEFAAKVSKESFADQVEYAFASQALHSMDDAVDSDYDEDSSTETESDELAKLSEDTKPKSQIEFAAQAEQKEEAKQVVAQPQENYIWYAKLVGFGSQKSASAFADRLHKKGIEVRIKTHMSKTASGKKRTWYQALTAEYTNKKEFDSVLDEIVKLEHLKRNDIQIVQTDAIAA